LKFIKNIGRKAPISLVKPVGKKGGGEVATSKKKNAGNNKKASKMKDLKLLLGNPKVREMMIKMGTLKKGGKVDDTMEKILRGMSAKERKAFLESMGFATKDKEGVSRSYRKAGGKMKSKGYKAGGKMKSKGYAGGGKVKAKIPSEDKMTKSQTGLSKKKATPSKNKNRTKDNDLFGMLSGLGYQRGVMPGETFKAGGKIKSKGLKGGGKMKSKGYKAGGKMKKKPQSGHNRLY